ncbi:hypothetical protein HS088_TW20G00253 [Tripterygium wilfordii]|uniref:Uncharacterized protein n=1 Tax=Tripterygium wilfordii TaxID=458696 RepID=A0A7J7C7S3_TRIWF|nr:hypothetical protein HS088_TW20G00253 [Tripterygium wilfordii]
MGRQPCCDKLGVKKGPWTAEEDKKLINFILTNGQCCWRAVPKLAGLRRCGKSCRLRWTNYLRPDLKRGLLTEAEEQLVIDLHARLGNRFLFLPLRLQQSCGSQCFLFYLSQLLRWTHTISYGSRGTVHDFTRIMCVHLNKVSLRITRFLMHFESTLDMVILFYQKQILNWVLILRDKLCQASHCLKQIMGFFFHKNQLVYYLWSTYLKKGGAPKYVSFVY